MELFRPYIACCRIAGNKKRWKYFHYPETEKKKTKKHNARGSVTSLVMSVVRGSPRSAVLVDAGDTASVAHDGEVDLVSVGPQLSVV